MSEKKSSYINIFPEIFEECIEGINSYINKLKSKSIKENFVDKHLDLLSLDYCDAAIGEAILNSDMVKSKQYFYLSAKIQEILFEKYDDKTIRVSPSFVSMNRYNKILLSLISDNDLLANSLARLIGGRTESEQGHPFSNNVGYAVKYILLDNYDKANESISILKNMDGDKEILLRKGYAVVLEGIIKSDIKTISAGLNQMLCDYKKNIEYKESPDELFCIPVIGFAKLAIKKGFDIKLSDPIVPPGIFEKQSIIYPEIDFV